MKIYFVRHGETDWNKDRKIQGQVNISLNEFGRHLARETAKGLKEIPFAVCFTSPLDRARETAVSYTHLDVYKRQIIRSLILNSDMR